MDEEVEIAPGVRAKGIDVDEVKSLLEQSSREPYRIAEPRRTEIIEEATASRYAVPIPLAKELMRNTVSDQSIALAQTTRLLQYFLFADDKGVISRPSEFRQKASRGQTRFKAVQGFVVALGEEGASASDASAAFEKFVSPSFPGISLPQLDYLCLHGAMFSHSAAMRDVILGRRPKPDQPVQRGEDKEFVLSDMIGTFLRMRHGTGYLATEAAADNPEAYFRNKKLTKMEMWHEIVLSEFEERIENLWKMLKIHPIAFLNLFEKLTAFDEDTLKEVRRVTNDLGGYDNTKRRSNITISTDDVLRAAYLKMRHGRKMTYDDVVAIVQPTVTDETNIRTVGNRLSREFRDLSWHNPFKASRSSGEGMKALVRIPGGFQTHVAGLEEIASLLRRQAKGQ